MARANTQVYLCGPVSYLHQSQLFGQINILYAGTEIRPNNKYVCLRTLKVTCPYLNLPVEPEFFQVFWKKHMLLKMHIINFFSEKKIFKKKTCVPTLP